MHFVWNTHSSRVQIADPGGAAAGLLPGLATILQQPCNDSATTLQQIGERGVTISKGIPNAIRTHTTTQLHLTVNPVQGFSFLIPLFCRLYWLCFNHLYDKRPMHF